MYLVDPFSITGIPSSSTSNTNSTNCIVTPFIFASSLSKYPFPIDAFPVLSTSVLLSSKMYPVNVLSYSSPSSSPPPSPSVSSCNSISTLSVSSSISMFSFPFTVFL